MADINAVFYEQIEIFDSWIVRIEILKHKLLANKSNDVAYNIFQMIVMIILVPFTLNFKFTSLKSKLQPDRYA